MNMVILENITRRLQLFIRYWILHSPSLTILFCICRVISILAPGPYGSKIVSDYADELSSVKRALYYGYESMFIKRERLIQQYTENPIQGLNKNELQCINVLVQDIYFENGESCSVSFNKFERILKFPRTYRILSGDVEGKKLIELFKQNSYEEAIWKPIYRYIATVAFSLKHDISMVQTIPFLVGDSGVGKSRMIRLIANKLEIPYLCIKPENFNNDSSILYQLFGTGFHNDRNLGIISSFLTNQIHPITEEVNPTNQYPIIIHVEEIDKIFNQTTRDVSDFRGFLYYLLDNGVVHDYRDHSLAGLKMQFDKCILVFTGNEEIKRRYHVEGNDSMVPDPYLASRILQLPFANITPEKKQVIAKHMVREIMLPFQDKYELTDTIRNMIKDIVEKDTNPGVRIMKGNIANCIYENILIQDGWEY